ncbi:MAG: hypothetical protein HGA45_18910 [Chloroflexales bacterium]|nr:hypothetical protein [Chloroflexales bacterium]
MASEQLDRRGRGEGEAERREGVLQAMLRRVIAPRTTSVLVMEPDGRLVSARPGDPDIHRASGSEPQSLTCLLPMT